MTVLKKNGLLVVISAPSGGGKSTIIQELFKTGDPRFAYSVSMTTRPRRSNEVADRDFIFVTAEEFQRYIDDDAFVEWATVHGNRYGTLKAHIDALLADGKIVLLDIDVQGGIAIKEKYGEEAFLVFIKPPSLHVLERRLRDRRTEREAEIAKRLSAVPNELALADRYDRIIVNRNLEQTVREVLDAIEEKHTFMNKTEE